MEKKKLLFVSGEPRVRKDFARAIRRSAYEFDVAGCGEEALARLEASDYPVVVAELRMPGIDGLMLMVRTRPIRPTTTFVLTTCSPDLDLKESGRLEDAIAAVIARPWSDSELVGGIQRAFRLHEERNSASLASPRLRVLLIDGDTANLISMKHALASVATVTCCASLDGALAQLRDELFSVVVVSPLSIPDACELDVLIKLQRARPESAIIVAGGQPDEDLALQALRFGAQDYLHSPLHAPEQLVRAVRFAHERKNVECHLAARAHFDELTGLANPLTLGDRIRVCLSKSRRRNQECALLHLDLDSFRSLNENHGHRVGDLVLQQVATRLRVPVREYDTVARLGGDQFAILMESFASKCPIEVAQRVLDYIRSPMTVGSLEVSIGVSGGLALFPESAQTIDGLVRSASKAMQSAKAQGRNCLHVFGG